MRAVTVRLDGDRVVDEMTGEIFAVPEGMKAIGWEGCGRCTRTVLLVLTVLGGRLMVNDDGRTHSCLLAKVSPRRKYTPRVV